MSQYETRRYVFRTHPGGEETELQGFGWDDLADEAVRLGLANRDTLGIQFGPDVGTVFRPWGTGWRVVANARIIREKEQP